MQTSGFLLLIRAAGSNFGISFNLVLNGRVHIPEIVLEASQGLLDLWSQFLQFGQGRNKNALSIGVAPFPKFADDRSVQERRNDDERSEEHTSELQSLRHLVCRLLLEKKKE